ncbi:hypothetical protein EDD18DRAFT_868467 [Armillaria luteobubalina]|uniref:Mediator of RNA polymerase II transcription subunit 21 n=1 Tax=Armillaria luteobubalina TaxID=153913 RepID=A0AA39P8Y2_9AGAR|nr:hypothetical protein EDD18DRAFT_868467 [Armillaria luteobubalina]
MHQELTHMDRITQLQDEIQQLLTIMSNSIAYLTTRANFLQYDPDEVFEANKKELVTDLMAKAKQVEYLIQSLPQPEEEEEQAKRLQQLEEEMTVANTEYIAALKRTKNLHSQVADLLRTMLSEHDIDVG